MAKELVNRTHADDVLPTGWTRHSETRLSVRVRWLPDHRRFHPVEGRYPSALVLETVRQTGLLVSHAELGVPFGHHFVMRDLRQQSLPEEMAAGEDPAEVVVEVHVAQLRRRGTVPADVELRMALHREGRAVAEGGTGYSLMSPAAYSRIRGEQTSPMPDPSTPLPAPLSPRAVRRTEAGDVVLSPTGSPRRWQLRADTGNLAFFDHPNDHIPGMVLVEAAHQAACVAAPHASFLASAADLSFSRYVEFGSPCWIEAEAPRETADGVAVRVTGHQDGLPVFEARLHGAATAE
ncbi:hypothetical protein LHJ74_33305 [Streptomyces sp. N2-109]|uniref:A-factor biosynthesis hotdog domain-containing protein n=1 Tax=Streptomyces gossypii TaxID=2883101 RepID=A0ABT2K3H9_9ACTN|nr:ScbA/BarX family gamma-butyrolactone biosynthesis protein [Streptomyces gossypii]MCT2594737.1 hypothetical protein [Streptomyces gossypii]